MAHVPAYVKDYLRHVPAVWDDTKFINGYPGKLAIIARKAGDHWYVAGINGENIEKGITVDLSFIGQQQGTLITDDNGKETFQNATLDLSENPKPKISLKPNGGFVIVF